VLIHAVKDAEESAFDTAAGGKGAHRADAPADFDKETFDNIRGAEFLPVGLRTVEKGQQSLHRAAALGAAF